MRDEARRVGVPERYRDDIAIEVFLRFEKHTSTITSPHVVRAWLRTTTVNVCHEYFDTRSTRYELPVATERLRNECLVQSAEERAVQNETYGELLEHVNALEPKRRAVFRAYVIDGLTMEEVAATLGIPVPTAYNRLRLARADLQAALHRTAVAKARRWNSRGAFTPWALWVGHLALAGFCWVVAQLRTLLRPREPPPQTLHTP
ncbi:MAG: sigma-70 family RNA polymerase sigma factor [Polyangiaceae bacterium]|nr:sigma-70 family RNA polymerase sigma factor [Polyangiaceae bacterium]